MKRLGDEKDGAGEAGGASFDASFQPELKPKGSTEWGQVRQNEGVMTIGRQPIWLIWEIR